MGELGQGSQRAAALGADDTIQELVRAGLRDRDYENLSTGGRLQAHAQLSGEGKRIICDCVDREPGLEINRFLLATEADLILEGAVIAAFATATPLLVIHVAEDDGVGADAVAAAVGKLGAAGVPGDDIAIEIVRGLFKPNLKGYEDVPTLVINGETLVNIGRVLRDGADRYREKGSAESPGTKVFQVSGCVNKPGIFELPLGTTLRCLIEDVCQGIKDGDKLQAVIVGGAKGGCYKEEELDLLLDFDNVRRSGGIIGSGGIAVLNDKDCIIDQTRQRISFSCYDDCGKCSLGREGSYQLREIIADMTRGKSRGSDLEMLREIGQTMQIGCACSAGKTAPNIILSTMEKFPAEYEAHMKRRLCKALVCEQYVTFHILPDLCDGCGDCAEECPEDAIEGGRKKIHVIDQDSCTKCAKCQEVCSTLRKAVVKAGPIKPRTPKKPIPVGTWKS
jgi:NADH-quinone oxidoreductase subunit F